MEDIGIITYRELKKTISNRDKNKNKLMVTGESEKFSFDIENSILQNKIQQINHNENDTDLKYDKLRDEINNLKNSLKM